VKETPQLDGLEENAMVIRRAQLFSLVALLLSALSIVGFARFGTSASDTLAARTFAGDPALKDLVNYRKWTQVTEKPFVVQDISSAQLVQLNFASRQTLI
jgi:hypothetical protein